LKRLGVVTALAAEARAFYPLMRRSRNRPGDELSVLNDGTLLAVSGIGCCAAGAAARALAAAPVSALMTFGLAGGLDPKLPAGSLILPKHVASNDGDRFAACHSWRARLADALGSSRAAAEGMVSVDGVLLSSAVALETPADKAAVFRDTGAVAVDMESATVARIAAAHRLPFIAIRVIVDTASDAIPQAATAASRTGRVQIGRLLAGLLLAPNEVAALIRLTRCYRAAMRSLRIIAASGAWAPLDSDTVLT
jgi:adenosylhomocysteine nucleosidase